MDMPGWEFGFGKRQKLHICSASAEHVESEPGAVYWLVGYRKGKQGPIGVSDLPQLAAHFGLEAVDLSSVPPTLREEVSPWFVDPKYEYKWLSIKGGEQAVGYQFAIVLYLALHLRKLAGRRLQCMHLVSSIQGRPNVRLPFWRTK
jgi:hypothetical protein